MKKSKVLIISASDSDLPVMQGAAEILEEFGVEHELTISSAHRSPDRTVKLVETFHKSGGKVIICGAGLAAHLAGVVAAHFPLPVIGVPLKGGSLSGLDALYATVQMPSGVPVATVGVDNVRNGALLAIQILATSDKKLEKKMIEYKKSLAEGVEKKSQGLEKVGLEQFLKERSS
ncbi:5-(carboxyamino)imidazole ribonucleotide mutase [Candidatus Daviesbacteria bacterium RIFCSPLOWO2_01_FULL_39_12]|uniref:N5-carboxyaminoimidazole ribonucleotide mutase n=1 Tax=Candidatus Daviesbacteria bacterium RIFCSPLOWO2_01_FULL_39_12 TaxID=1797785 RepID=A0A1F5KU04_9BACT|nr:MAG: 5-(carboxyamino)imidazole ribonucleotide mutase [Candidatus Daviesbacteria bacterium RIFCSPHIGHO2_02_FULL_39_8]OGE44396.1 MAG: 5-(carboxyamino)imidazole ribonucleotide mutase [Candidatus Daviesbacteria bacterium RIFCSPLOWO2_01_FULL_39_12]